MLTLWQHVSKDIIICDVAKLSYPYSYSSTFPDTLQGTTLPPSANGTKASSVIKLAAILPNSANGSVTPQDTLDELRVFEFRYSRYILDPRTGLWYMIRYVPA